MLLPHESFVAWLHMLAWDSSYLAACELCTALVPTCSITVVIVNTVLYRVVVLFLVVWLTLLRYLGITGTTDTNNQEYYC
jgi:hypothetical protein